MVITRKCAERVFSYLTVLLLYFDFFSKDTKKKKKNKILDMKRMACYVYTYNHIIFINVLYASMTIYENRTNCDAVNALPFKWHIYRNFPAHCPLLFLRPKGRWRGMKWGELSQSPFNIRLISILHIACVYAKDQTEWPSTIQRRL